MTATWLASAHNAACASPPKVRAVGGEREQQRNEVTHDALQGKLVQRSRRSKGRARRGQTRKEQRKEGRGEVRAVKGRRGDIVRAVSVDEETRSHERQTGATRKKVKGATKK